MEKYPEDLMRAMGYFEFFYMQQLEDEKKTIKKFKEKYPDISKGLKKKMQSLYSLNQARKSMRESMALTLDDDPEKALERYMLMYNFLGQGEKKIEKLTSSEKKLKRESANFKKHYGSFKKTVQLKREKRIDQKTFDKDLKKKSDYHYIQIDPFFRKEHFAVSFRGNSTNFKKNINKVSKTGGMILLITGILIITNQLQIVGYYIFNIFPFFQNFG
mgnify:CR=1 FL=1